MIKIIEKKSFPRGIYYFRFSNNEEWEISAYTFYQFKDILKEENEITEEEYKKIKFEAEYELAKSKAYNCISRKNYTEKELSDKLNQSSFEKKTIEKVIDHLKSKDYLKDEQYLKDWALTKVKARFWGPYKLKQHLKERTNDQILIESIISSTYKELNEDELINHLLKKKNKKPPFTDNKEKSKIYRLLMQSGFSNEAVQSILF